MLGTTRKYGELQSAAIFLTEIPTSASRNDGANELLRGTQLRRHFDATTTPDVGPTSPLQLRRNVTERHPRHRSSDGQSAIDAVISIPMFQPRESTNLPSGWYTGTRVLARFFWPQLVEMSGALSGSTQNRRRPQSSFHV